VRTSNSNINTSLQQYKINTILYFLDIIHHPVFYFKKFRRLDCLRPQVEAYSVGPHRQN
jgi:hypothetical protein